MTLLYGLLHPKENVVRSCLCRARSRVSRWFMFIVLAQELPPFSFSFFFVSILDNLMALYQLYSTLLRCFTLAENQASTRTNRSWSETACVYSANCRSLRNIAQENVRPESHVVSRSDDRRGTVFWAWEWQISQVVACIYGKEHWRFIIPS